MKFDHTKGSVLEALGLEEGKAEKWAEEVSGVCEGYRGAIDAPASRRIEILYDYFNGRANEPLKMALLVDFLVFSIAERCIWKARNDLIMEIKLLYGGAENELDA